MQTLLRGNLVLFTQQKLTGRNQKWKKNHFRTKGTQENWRKSKNWSPSLNDRTYSLRGMLTSNFLCKGNTEGCKLSRRFLEGNFLTQVLDGQVTVIHHWIHCSQIRKDCLGLWQSNRSVSYRYNSDVQVPARCEEGKEKSTKPWLQESRPGWAHGVHRGLLSQEKRRLSRERPKSSLPTPKRRLQRTQSQTLNGGVQQKKERHYSDWNRWCSNWTQAKKKSLWGELWNRLHRKIA